jgi:hypothetical protein
MSSGATSPVVTQTQTRDPWSGVQPYLSGMYQTADVMRAQNQGYTPYTGPTQAALDPYAQAGLGNLLNMGSYYSQAGVPGIADAQNLGDYVINQQGITPGIQQSISGLGQAGNQYQQIYNQNIGTQNPYLQDVIDQQMNQVQSAMSGAGRYGSGDYTAGIARAIAPTLAQDYMARQQLAEQATGGLAQTYQQQAGLYNQGLQQAGQWAQAEPGFYQASLAPMQTELAAGDILGQRAQNDLNAQIAQYNAQQAYPWQQLEREAAILAGAGQLGGTQVTAQTPQQAPTLQRLLGGALVGGGLGSSFGPVGTGVGALGGAGLGYFL